ncbi:MAG: hypothetical protein ACXADU_07445 [Promethearchaeota archaeon]|jgi:hypothetical protein
MEFKRFLNIQLLILIGPILLILSEFFPWFSDENLIELYVIFTLGQIGDSFLFLFPIISGIICLIASGLIIYKIELRIKFVILSFLGLGFQLLFFIFYISEVIAFFPEAGAGLYLGVFGFLLIIINLIYVLTVADKESGG